MNGRIGLFLAIAVAVGIAFAIGAAYGRKKILARSLDAKATIVKGFCKE